MPLTSGSRLAPLGSGVQGEVYRARDTKLGRDVAIKVLPEEFARDRERLDRFEREARLLAQLNHANIATLHGLEEHDGQQFLVMELVEGETLAERIAQGPLPVDEAIPLFIQIAEGLEAAHEKGIIHRDLKPANIKIGANGKPKILDFGLAKALGGESAPQNLSQSPTLTRNASETGVLLGTAPCMSPEQARGTPVDKRTDVWAFGCCLFEALSGQAIFYGATVSDTLARVLEREPDWGALPETTTGSVQRVLRRCLTKEQRARFHDIADARIALEWPIGAVTVTPARRGLWMALFTVTLASVALSSFFFLKPSLPTGRRVFRTIIPLPTGEHLTRDPAAAAIALSPDGKIIAFTTRGDASTRLYLRALDSLSPTRVDGGDGGANPFFSPDGRWVDFTKNQGLSRAAVTGGASLQIVAVGGSPRRVDWTPRELVFPIKSSSGLFRSSGSLETFEALTRLDQSRKEITYRLPQVLPGGESVLFTIGSSTTDSWSDGELAVASMKTGTYKIVHRGGSHARYSPSGHLLYARNGSLFAVSFDVDRLEVIGQPVEVLANVVHGNNRPNRHGCLDHVFERRPTNGTSPGRQSK